MKIKLTLSYDGTAYCGWQRQKNGLSVQEVVEDAVYKLTGETVTVTGSGRTDAGVHAAAQVVSFSLDSTIPPERLYLALNAYLPDDVKATASEAADENFNARYSAKKKTYRYSFYYSDVVLPLKDRYATRTSSQGLDFIRMIAFADALVGVHDFSAFSGVGSSIKTSVRTIYSIDIREFAEGFTIDVCGNGFLYNMVRIIAGAVYAAGTGEVDEGDALTALSTGKRHKLFKTLPAKGLTLVGVEYE